ncbi:MAG TPA: hypothetical protein VMB20_01205 [Candidatus Acidoferrum sp.]|nr:hypothetical protein [Candidatus Acidoferrum sp.]
MKVIDALPAPTAVTVNVVPEAGPTVATAAPFDCAENVPVYPLSLTVTLAV